MVVQTLGIMTRMWYNVLWCLFVCDTDFLYLLMKAPIHICKLINTVYRNQIHDTTHLKDYGVSNSMYIITKLDNNRESHWKQSQNHDTWALYQHLLKVLYGYLCSLLIIHEPNINIQKS